MADKKITVVVGATGAQGGGLARAILEDRRWQIRGPRITRDASTPQAMALAELGADVVVSDIDDVASLTRALHGAYGAYFVTFFWAHLSPEREMDEARIRITSAVCGRNPRPVR